MREPGEFAVRGGIVDLFPPGFEEPLRLDLFGDEVEKIRSFDPISQRTTGERRSLSLETMAEFTLDEESITRFRNGYRELFGAVANDPLYEAVSAGRRYGGMEHWLPLLHARMETIFDYAPDAAVSLDPQADEAFGARLAQIADFYQARLDLQKAEARSNSAVYKPLPPGPPVPDRGRAGRQAGAARGAAAVGVREGRGRGGTASTGGGRRGRDFSDVRTTQAAELYEIIRDYLARHRNEGRAGLIAAYSQGSRHRLMGVLAGARPRPAGSGRQLARRRQPAQGRDRRRGAGARNRFHRAGCLLRVGAGHPGRPAGAAAEEAAGAATSSPSMLAN